MGASNWSPRSLSEGPPLPNIFEIYWPWYKREAATPITTTPPTTVTEPTKKTYKVKLTSEPSGAKATLPLGSLGDYPLGVTPIVLEFLPGNATLEMTLAGYKTWSKTVTIDSDTTLNAKLEKETAVVPKETTPPSVAQPSKKYFVITAQATPPGFGTITLSPNKNQYEEGESVSLSAQPSSSAYRFNIINDQYGQHYENDHITIRVTKDNAFYAVFSAVESQPEEEPDVTPIFRFRVTQHGLENYGAEYWRVEHFDSNHNMDYYSDHVPVSQRSIDLPPVSATGNIGIAYYDAGQNHMGTWYSDSFSASPNHDYQYYF